jgi:hypothetical protein
MEIHTNTHTNKHTMYLLGAREGATGASASEPIKDIIIIHH